MNVIRPTVDDYYPPTPENLTQANKDVNESRRLQDGTGLELIAHALGEASRRLAEQKTTVNPDPYLDISVRCATLRGEISEQQAFTASH